MLDGDYCAILCTFSLFTCHVDVIQALTHQLDAEWREFGTFLHVDPAIMDGIGKDRTNVYRSMYVATSGRLGGTQARDR